MTAPSSARSGRFGSLGPGFWFRFGSMAIIDAMALWAMYSLIDQEQWLVMAALAVGAIGLNFIYFSSKTIPLRYIAPGLVFLAVFIIYPIGYTIYLSMTNFDQANNVNKEQATASLESIKVISDDPAEFALTVYEAPDGELRFLLVDDDGATCFGEPRLKTDPPSDTTCESIPLDDPANPPDEIDGSTKLRLIDLVAVEGELLASAIDTPVGEAVVVTASTAQSGQIQRYTYDAARDVLVDNIEETECVPTDGNYVCADGRTLTPGWRIFIGADNYVDALTDQRVGGPLLRVFTWNVIFAVSVVFLQLALGLGLALTLHNVQLRGIKFYRSILILPYAIPAFISVLIWRGLMDTNFGPINNDLLAWTGYAVPWLTNGFWAKVSVILVTVWQGFPYMMLISMGALQSIPTSLIEAAKVDGANGWQTFRKVTFPMLMVIIAPLLIASFAFNFNNFINIFLLTNGGPQLLTYDVPVGETDLLITFTFSLSQNAGRFALAATFAILIFIIVALISAFSFRFTKRLERLYGNL